MIRDIQWFWWALIGAQRFRIRYDGERYSKRMSYRYATHAVKYFGGHVVCDYNKVLQP